MPRRSEWHYLQERPLAALLNAEGFRQKIAGLIAETDAAGRREDLDRIVARVQAGSPQEVSQLAALTFLLDEDYRLKLQEALDAFRRWHQKKGAAIDEDAILEVMFDVYKQARDGS